MAVVEGSQVVKELRQQADGVRTTVTIHPPVPSPDGRFAFVSVDASSTWDREGTSQSFTFVVVDVQRCQVVDSSLSRYISINEWGRTGGWSGAENVQWVPSSPGELSAVVFGQPKRLKFSE